MKNIIAFFLMAGMAISCSPGKPPITYYAESDGKSFETAVLINERTESKGINAEYAWIREHRSDYKVVRQALSYHNKKNYDVITIQFANGSEEKIYFDISKFYGHL